MLGDTRCAKPRIKVSVVAQGRAAWVVWRCGQNEAKLAAGVRWTGLASWQQNEANLMWDGRSRGPVWSWFAERSQLRREGAHSHIRHAIASKTKRLKAARFRAKAARSSTENENRATDEHRSTQIVCL